MSPSLSLRVPRVAVAIVIDASLVLQVRLFFHLNLEVFVPNFVIRGAGVAETTGEWHRQQRKKQERQRE